MKKILLISGLLLAVGLSWAYGPEQTALNQVHDVYAEMLANSLYFDEYFHKFENRHGLSDFDKLWGEAELLRWSAGAPFVQNMSGVWQFTNMDDNPLNVEYYHKYPVSDPSYRMIMTNPHGKKMQDLEYDPNYVDTEGMSVDDMFLMAIGGDEAVKASANSNYQGNYQTGVGGRTEQEGFDLELAKQIAKNANRQAAADEKYRQMNSGGSHGGGGESGGFWATLGKNFMMGLANMAANLPAEYARFEQEQAQKRKAIAEYNAQVDAYNRAQWENYYNQVNAQNSYSGGGGSSYSRPAAPQISPAQRCEQSCRNTGSIHLHHRGSHWDGRVCQCDVCDDRLQRC